MNLLEALNYRNNCLICQQPMELKCPELLTFNVVLVSKGLMLVGKARKFDLLFNFDGTCQITPRAISSYFCPLKVVKECPTCCQQKITERMNMTTVQNLKTMRCAYGISITSTENNFTTTIDRETIKYHDSI